MWSEYCRFADLRAAADKTNTLDMQSVDWVYPTTLLPLTGYLVQSTDKKLGYRPPANSGVGDYIRFMIQNPNRSLSQGTSYVRNNFLPASRRGADAVIARIMDLQDDGKGLGGQSVFAYLIGELIDNIYEHSQFSNAMVMAQRYARKGFVEVTFYDDGITIAGSLRRAGLNYLTDIDAIKDALRGKSSKKDTERGYGLDTNVRMCTDINGLGGKALIVSGCGAFEYGQEKSDQRLYNLQENPYSLRGTLISFRIPYPAKEVDLYAFTQ